ncbi:LacI family transcriptional regulator [Kroppenstedtia pulmonis]|uniref:LacI family transcriptional regulator n=1 Tax=Kroppenstedtia pulmonis TaxID=1380685 RepID=A0A7D4BE42_9BACL|nr:LacI family DNA-binding transcriptional regulator [Kroppenstedtia pulmonis]QKG83272.1 LacI family transcriptional regulator [Kroppenstedtia pulmonis]
MMTIKEIAKLANVSSSTVSRVLNDGYVSDEVRQRVLKIIEETGYVPSEHAKSLRTKRTKVIGVILPRLSTETSIRIVNALNDELAREGYQMILTNTNLKQEKEIENLNLLKSRQVDGIILLATNINDRLIHEIKQLHIPLIVIGQEIPNVSIIINDDYQAAREMTERLIHKGYEQIGFIGVTEEDHAVGYLRKQGYVDALKEHQLEIREEWMAEATFDFESGYQAMKEIREGSRIMPTAVFAVTDNIAIGAMQYLKEEHFLVPDDIALVGTGNSNMAKYIDPPLSTIDFLNEKTGQEAARMILQHIRNPSIKHQKKVMEYRLIERNSV